MRRSHRAKFQKIHPGGRVKFRSKVNVTVHFGLAARDRAEQRKGTQARLAQFFLVCAQRRNNPLGRVHDQHCSTREKRWESVFGLLLNG